MQIKSNMIIEILIDSAQLLYIKSIAVKNFKIIHRFYTVQLKIFQRKIYFAVFLLQNAIMCFWLLDV